MEKQSNSKIYLLKAGSYYKIGITSGTVENRIKQLQTGNPETISIVHVITDMSEEHVRYYESALHKFFDSLRLSGEWFNLTDEHVLKTIGIMDFIQCAPAFTKPALPEKPLTEPWQYEEEIAVLKYSLSDLTYAFEYAEILLQTLSPNLVESMGDKILEYGAFTAWTTHNKDYLVEAYIEAGRVRDHEDSSNHRATTNLS